jgi:predicted Rossmann fold nucleotide-binding protein DprA/Smf involved in DNA uptake
VLGNADRLQVAAAVAQSSSGMVHAQELANALGITAPRVRTQLLAFTAAGLMQQLPRHGSTVDYQRCPDPFWDAAEKLAAAWS